MRYQVAVLIEVETTDEDPYQAQTFVAAALGEVFGSYRDEGDLSDDDIEQVTVYVSEAKEAEDVPEGWWRRYVFTEGDDGIDPNDPAGWKDPDDDELANIPF